MKKIILTIAVGVFSFAIASQLYAAPRSGGSRPSSGPAQVQSSNFSNAAKSINIANVNKVVPNKVVSNNVLSNKVVANKVVSNALSNKVVSSKAIASKMTKLNPTKVANYHLSFGTKFAHGYCYHGKHHCHWGFTCWHPHYGCSLYWDTCVCNWYYWCVPDCCYYPVTYCPYQTYCCWSPVVLTQPVYSTAVLPMAVQGETAAPPVNDLATSEAPPIPEPLAPINKE